MCHKLTYRFCEELFAFFQIDPKYRSLDNLNHAALFLTLNTNPLIGIFGVELGGGGCLVWKRGERSPI